MSKNKLLLLALIVFSALSLFADYFKDFEVNCKIPNGKSLKLLATGDEFYSRIHDKNGYTLVQHEDGWYYYGKNNAKGEVIPTGHKFGEHDPATLGLEKNIRISEDLYKERRREFLSYGNTRATERSPHFGVFNNIVIYIRFSDQSEFTTTRADYDSKFNDRTPGAESMYNYYDEVSYNNLEMRSYHYPISASNTNVSYQDSHPRAYFEPYNATTNPEGYQGNQKTQREHQLLADAISFVESQIPDTLVIDGDNDGIVDNVCFIIRGGNDGWSDLLWAHRWWLFSRDAYIHGVSVSDYTFQPSTQNDVSTLCHEMFHSLGAPDLYRYNYDATPVGQWDLMASNFTHMGAYMKYKYGGWIQDIPVISESRQYTLYPLHTQFDNCFRINSPSSTQEYFVVEYRKREPGTFEENVPGSGLIITRINRAADGEGNAQGPPDEVYVYRPGGTPTSDGEVNQAYFSANVGRTSFSNTTDPSCFLQSGIMGDIEIHQVGEAGDSITFILSPSNGYIDLTVSSDNPDADYSEGEIILGHNRYSLNAAGSYLIETLQGDYELKYEQPGYTNFVQNIRVNPDETIQVQVNTEYLSGPENFAYTLQGNDAVFTWHHETNDPDFEEYKVIGIAPNGVATPLASTTDTTLTRRVPVHLNLQFFAMAIYADGTSDSSNMVVVSPTAYDDKAVPAFNARLLGNSPNPFNPVTTIRYQVTKPANAEFDIFNVLGQKVKTISHTALSKGEHSVVWNGKNANGGNVGSGIYYYKLKIDGNIVGTKKMLLLK